MSGEELRNKYRKSKTYQAINAAIRGEIPGGDEFLDLLEKTYRLSAKQSEYQKDFIEIFESMKAIRSHFVDVINQKYHLFEGSKND